MQDEGDLYNIQVVVMIAETTLLLLGLAIERPWLAQGETFHLYTNGLT